MEPEPEPEPELETLAPGLFSVATLRRCRPQPWPAGTTLLEVETLRTFESVSAEVVQLSLTIDDGSAIVVVGKGATGSWNHGAGLRAVRRELAVFRDIAPLWACPCLRLLGVCDDGSDAGPALFLAEDLGAAGYALVGGGVSLAQLQGAVDRLVAQHAAFWGKLQEGLLDHANPSPSLTQSGQAWPPAVITMHAAEIRKGIAAFLASEAGGELTDDESALLTELLELWEQRFLERVTGKRNVTLIHGDFHVLGNVLFRPDDPSPKVIDWSELKPGLGPHDVAYMLISAPSDERASRDQGLLRRYWKGVST